MSGTKAAALVWVPDIERVPTGHRQPDGTGRSDPPDLVSATAAGAAATGAGVT